jgi:hypothetical protein
MISCSIAASRQINLWTSMGNCGKQGKAEAGAGAEAEAEFEPLLRDKE